MVDREPSHLLGRHVAPVPITVPGSVWPEASGARLLARGRLDPLRQAEVEDLDLTVLGDEEVLGLQVPVDDPSRARRRGPGRPGGRSPRPASGDRTCASLPRSVSPSRSSMTA